MMALLSSVYLANVVVGTLDKSILSGVERRQRYARGWLPVHISLSMITMVVAGLHIYIALAYKGG